METLLVWASHRFRPPRGWVPLLLTVVALLCLPAAFIFVADNSPVADPISRLGSIRAPALALTLLGALVGMALAQTRISGWRAMALGGLLGGLLTAVIIGRLSPPWSLMWSEAEMLIDWLRLRQQGTVGWPFPFVSAVGFVWQRLTELGDLLWWDVLTVAGGGSISQTRAHLLLAALLAWMLAFHGAWQIYHRRAALSGLFPGGIALATLAFYHPGATFYFFTLLFCTLWLMAICHLWTHRDRWRQIGADYPADLGTELVISLGPWILALLLAAGLFPNRGFWRISRTLWEQAERAFGPFDEGYSDDSGGGILPRSHLLGGRPGLAETIVFYVSTNDPPPLAGSEEGYQSTAPGLTPRYWRGDTLDVYGGRGWNSSPMEIVAASPNEVLDPTVPRGFELSQSFERFSSNKGILVAANAPVHLDHSVLGWWRSPGDLARLTSDASSYSVISWTPEPTIEDLRSASPFVPQDLAERYLALPESVPQRVRDLAQRVVEGAENRYEQARAIETFLRAYPYNLEVPEPPSERDVVDYFLFDLQQGYCDYYASAMVVMARTVGIPARFVTGYSQGEYDYDANRWVVTEMNGHSWVEVYFDGFGWVEFEPTAGLPVLDRSGGESQARPSVPPLPVGPQNWWDPIPWALVLVFTLLGILVALVTWMWLTRRPREATPAGLVRDRYARLLRWGLRLGQPYGRGQTPHEYGSALGTRLRARGQDSRWSHLRRAASTAPAEVERLTGTFVRAQYGKDSITHSEGAMTRSLWARLRRALWWLWLARH